LKMTYFRLFTYQDSSSWGTHRVYFLTLHHTSLVSTTNGFLLLFSDMLHKLCGNGEKIGECGEYS